MEAWESYWVQSRCIFKVHIGRGKSLRDEALKTRSFSYASPSRVLGSEPVTHSAFSFLWGVEAQILLWLTEHMSVKHHLILFPALPLSGVCFPLHRTTWEDCCVPLLSSFCVLMWLLVTLCLIACRSPPLLPPWNGLTTRHLRCLFLQPRILKVSSRVILNSLHRNLLWSSPNTAFCPSVLTL